jgi:hypothetical protein
MPLGIVTSALVWEAKRHLSNCNPFLLPRPIFLMRRQRPSPC